MATTNVQFVDLDAARALLHDVRADSSATNWYVGLVPVLCECRNGHLHPTDSLVDWCGVRATEHF
jgi:hypothetical protein